MALPMLIRRVKRVQLVGYISTWLYSEGDPPEPINDLFLRWMDKGAVPSSGELTLAMRQSDEILARRRGVNFS